MRNVPRLIQKAMEHRAVVLLHSRDILAYNLGRMIEYVFHSTLWVFSQATKKGYNRTVKQATITLIIQMIHGL